MFNDLDIHRSAKVKPKERKRDCSALIAPVWECQCQGRMFTQVTMRDAGRETRRCVVF